MAQGKGIISVPLETPELASNPVPHKEQLRPWGPKPSPRSTPLTILLRRKGSLRASNPKILQSLPQKEQRDQQDQQKSRFPCPELQGKFPLFPELE